MSEADVSALGAMPTATGRTTDEVDEIARSIARAHVDGRIDAREAADRFATLVATSAVLYEVANYPAGLSTQQRYDLGESLRWSLTNAVLDVERGFFDTSRMLTASFSGWLRQTGIAFSSRNGIVRPRTLAERLTLVSDLVSPAHDSAFALLAEQSAESQATRTDIEAVLGDPEELVARAKGMRASTRAFALSAALRRAMDLPRLCVPADEADKQWVLDTCRQDPRAAGRSVRSVVEIICGLTDNPIDIDERLLALWDDCPLERLQALESVPDEFVSVLVIGQVMPAPKPNRTVVRALRKEARALVPSRAWQELSTLLVASYLARNTSPVSDFDGLADDVARAAMAAEARRLAAQWPDLVSSAASWPGQPMGPDEEAIDAWLGERLHALTEVD